MDVFRQNVNIIINLIYSNFIFSLMDDVRHFQNYQKDNLTPLFAADMTIIAFILVMLCLNLSFILFYFGISSSVKKKTGNILLLFLDISKQEVYKLYKKTDKFLGFCSVSSLVVLNRA